MEHSATGKAPPLHESAPGNRRRFIVLLVALLAAGAVMAGIIIADRPDAPAAPGQTAAAPQGPAAPGPASAPASPVAGPASPAPQPAPPADVQKQVQTILQTTEQLDATVFAREVEAQEYEEYFIRLWDDIRAAKDKTEVLREMKFGTLLFGKPTETARHDWDITTTHFEGLDHSVDLAGWQRMLDRLGGDGYRLVEVEFHQAEFQHERGQPARSAVNTIVHLVNDKLSSRTAVRTKLKVEWADERDKPGKDGMFVPKTIQATEITVANREGEVPFEPMVLPGGDRRGLKVEEAAQFVLAYDLGDDGLSEIVIPRENAVFRNLGGGRFGREQLVPGQERGEPMHAGLISDFNGDGHPDLLCSKGAELYLVRGVGGGRFSSSPPERAATLEFPLLGLSALTAGDIDGDGDLDAFFGQYKRPYVDGQMPTPYYDSNDGYPGALLVNDGTGRFTDGTEAAGLTPKRHRRTLAASYIDLDGDRDQDLLVNSDFAGLDLYYNDGRGRFTDVTDQVIDERHNFGMGHTFADYNLDGLLDMYTIGMSSTTARRLTAMGAGREEFPEHQEKRPQMGYGNRMFLATPPSGSGPAKFVQPTFRDQVARTGWSWGATSPDIDNDGDPDIYVANGHLSGQSCRDYCTTYWRRDVYLGSSKEDPVMKNLFDNHGMTNEVSWNGFEHNVLFMNEGGKSFLNVAHLVGVAFEFDSRGILSDDLDGDGQMELIVTEQRSWDKSRYLHVLKNKWPTRHNWVGVRLAETSPGFSPIGAEVRVRTARGVQPARIVAGDSYLAQHANAKHFGLGAEDKVESIEVTWPNGQTTRLDSPAVNRWHDVRPAGSTAAAAIR